LNPEFFLEIQDFNQKMQKSLDFGTESILAYNIKNSLNKPIKSKKY